MLSGENVWPSHLSSDLHTINIWGRDLQTYIGKPKSLYETLSDTATQHCNKTAVKCEDEVSYTFLEIKQFVDGFAYVLANKYSIKRGSRVGLLLDNGVDFIVAFYATNALGAVLVPLPGKFAQPEVLSLSRRASLNLVISHPNKQDWFRNEKYPVIVTDSVGCAFGLPIVNKMHHDSTSDSLDLTKKHSLTDNQNTDFIPKQRLEDDALLLFTSGTTSLSKGVLLTNLNAVHAVISYQRVLDLKEEDNTIIAVPFYHVTGLIAIIALFIYLGGTIHVQKRMHGDIFLQEIIDSNITFIHASPTVFALMLRYRDKFPSLDSVKQLACGAAHMPVNRIHELHNWMPKMKFRTIYGLTESCSPGLVFPGDAYSSPFEGSSGFPIPGMAVKIVDDNGNECDSNEVGEILLYGANITRGYLNESPNSFTSDGWLRTGDLGRYTPEGYVYIVDRIKDMVNRGGEKIWCIDVEEALRELPGINDALLVGMPDDLYGEVPVAGIVMEPGHIFNHEEIDLQLRKSLAKYQIPTSYLQLEKIPETVGGKPDKKALRMQICRTRNSYPL